MVDARRKKTQSRIIAVMKKYPISTTALIAEELKIKPKTINGQICRLRALGVVQRVRFGLYRLVGEDSAMWVRLR
jgi:Mn-dependent DtxR family transcriptional regulator